MGKLHCFRSGIKDVHTEWEVKVNGEVETRRGKKIYDGYVVEFNGKR